MSTTVSAPDRSGPAARPASGHWLRAARALIVRDLRLTWRRRGDAFQPALFALLVVTLFALAFGGEARMLARVAPPVLWVAVLLAGLLALDSLFRGDADDGSLEQWMLAPLPLALAQAAPALPAQVHAKLAMPAGIGSLITTLCATTLPTLVTVTV